MRLIAIILGGAALAAVMLAALGASAATPAPDAAIDVLTSSPVRAFVSATPTASEIVETVVEAIDRRMRELRDGAMRDHLGDLAADDEYLRDLGTRAVESLGRGGAAALAFPIYRVDTSRSIVRVFVTTIEVLPESRSLSLSVSHEDGHALINDLIALSCAPELVRAAIDRELSPRGISFTVAEQLLALGDVAHDAYHAAVVNDRARGHERRAREAATAAVAAGCT